MIRLNGSSHGLLLMGVVLVLLGTSVPLPAADNSQGNASATFLKLDPSAQSAGFGSAYLGKQGALATYFNPAGLSNVRETRTVLSQNDIFAGITYRYLSVTTSEELFGGGVGFSVTNLDYGRQDRTRVRGNDPVTRGLGDFGASDLAFSATHGFEMTNSLSVGYGLKYIQAGIAGYSAGTFSGDVGFQYETSLPGLRLGLSGRNLFGNLKFNKREDPLPRVFEFGGNYGFALDPGYHEFELGAGIGMAKDSDEYLFSGIAYDLYRVASFRVGYHGSQEAGSGLTAGFGLSYGGVSVSYAYVPFGELGYQQRFSLNVALGEAESEPERNNRSRDRRRRASPSKQSWMADFRRAKQLLREGYTRKAYGLLKRLQGENNKRVPVLLQLGMVEIQLGDYASARRRFEKVLELDPGNRQARKALKTVREAAGEVTADTLVERARSHWRHERMEKARDVLLKARKQYPANLDVLYWLGRVEARLGLQKKARNRFLKILEIDPDNERARDAILEMD